MFRGEGGWWTVEDDHTGCYAFVVDGDVLPDPRSPFQPDGVNGPSCTVDHAAFAWTDAGWSGRPLAGRVVYELHTGTFSPQGTFAGVVERLDHLVELGVDAIEVMPIATFDGRWGWGYDGAALWAPHPAYGGPDGFKALVDACHRRGLAVVLDVVYNHLGPVGNHLDRFGPYFTDRVATPWGDAVNLDGPGSDEVRRFIVDNACSWVRDYHVDGLRLDAVHALHDESATHLLQELAEAVHAEGARLGRTVWVIGESDLNDPRLVWSVDAGGLGLDATWVDDFHHALRVALTGDRSGYYVDYAGWPDVVRALQQVYVFDGRYSVSRGRKHGRPAGALDRSRFVVADQTHDQVGNRAVGDRPYDIDTQIAAAAVVLLSPFVVLLFQGEEWATTTPFAFFTDFADPELADSIRSGRIREFGDAGWDPDAVLDPQDVATYRSSVVRWAELDDPRHREAFDAYRVLIDVRRGMPPSATVEAHLESDRFVMTRGDVRLEIGIPTPWLHLTRAARCSDVVEVVLSRTHPA